MSGARSIVSAELKGRKAAEAGQPRTANPYQNNGPVGFATRFRKAWFKGYDAVKVLK